MISIKWPSQSPQTKTEMLVCPHRDSIHTAMGENYKDKQKVVKCKSHLARKNYASICMVKMFEMMHFQTKFK